MGLHVWMGTMKRHAACKHGGTACAAIQPTRSRPCSSNAALNDKAKRTRKKPARDPSGWRIAKRCAAYTTVSSCGPDSAPLATTSARRCSYVAAGGVTDASDAVSQIRSGCGRPSSRRAGRYAS